MNATRLLETVLAHPLQAGVLLLLLASVYKASIAVYRLYFHPLSGFPGPREAALSDTWLWKLSEAGSQEQEFERLHEEYGTKKEISLTALSYPTNSIDPGTQALRIGPNELHLTDVSKYKTIYSQSRPYPKHEAFYLGFGTPHTTFTEVDFALHKERRRLHRPFFARSGILKIEPALKKHVEALRLKLCRLSDRGELILAHNAFRCVTVDIISEFAFAKSRLLVDGSDDSFQADWPKTFDAAAAIIWRTIYNPLARQLGELLPKSLVAPFSPSLRRIFALVDEGLASLEAHRSAEKKENDGPVIFDNLQHLSDQDAGMEAVDFLVAGSDTTAITLTFAVWHICHDPAIKRKLVAAFKEAALPTQQNEDGDYPTLLDLEAIPYLVACVKESLRVAMPVPGRLPRVVPHAGGGVELLVVDDKVVPPGAVVGMGAYTMHNSEELWGPNARHFEPERWLGEDAKGLDENLVTFSKGARNCIGQTLAQAELLFVIFMLFRNFDIELDAVSEKGVKTRDQFTQSVQEPGLVLKMRRIV